MVDIQRILCPTDFSTHARRSLDAAIVLARWYRAEITVLHVVPAGVVADRAAAESDPSLRDELCRFAEVATAEGIPTHVALRVGGPVDEILAEADERDAGLMVIGTHGRGGFERWVLGSVCDKLLRKAPCPVLSVPHRPETGERHPWVFRNILCAVDFSATSLKALDYAVSVTREADAHLTLVHVVEGLPDHEPRINLHFNVAEYRLYVLRDARERLGRLLPEEARGWCEAATSVAIGKAYREILRAARDMEADLIVIGVHGWGAMDPRLFGATAHHVIREAACPVLTIRSRSGHECP
jgi:nucleotide-binding universal stress UspA family protein